MNREDYEANRRWREKRKAACRECVKPLFALAFLLVLAAAGAVLLCRAIDTTWLGDIAIGMTLGSMAVNVWVAWWKP
jgi:hypothetical protein